MSKKISVPKIAQLKQEVKRLAREEAVGLRTAYNRVAQKYGFSTWKELKIYIVGPALVRVPFGECRPSIESLSHMYKHTKTSVTAMYLNSPQESGCFTCQIPVSDTLSKWTAKVIEFFPKLVPAALSPTALLEFSSTDWIESIARAIRLIPPGFNYLLDPYQGNIFGVELPTLFIYAVESDGTTARIVPTEEFSVLHVFPGPLNARIHKSWSQHDTPTDSHRKDAAEWYWSYVESYEVSPEAPWLPK
jgi:hypothetical protein